MAEPAYGPRPLDRLADGEPVPDAFGEQLEADALAAVRQVAAIDPRGGSPCTPARTASPYAGHVAGDGFTCQANMMARETVPGRCRRLRGADGPAAERLVAALDGGRGRGR